jgi:hypothetical protein
VVIVKAGVAARCGGAVVTTVRAPPEGRQRARKNSALKVWSTELDGVSVARKRQLALFAYAGG